MFTDGKKQFGHQQLASAQNTHTHFHRAWCSYNRILFHWLSWFRLKLSLKNLDTCQSLLSTHLHERNMRNPILTFKWYNACLLCFQPALISRWNPEEPSMVLVVLNLSRPNPTPSESEEAILNLSNKRPIAKYKDWHYKWYTFFFAPISRNFAPTSRNFAPFSHQAIGSNCCQIRQTACELYDTSYFCNFSSTTWHQQPMVALSSRSKAVMASNQEDGISSCGWFHR